MGNARFELCFRFNKGDDLLILKRDGELSDGQEAGISQQSYYR